MWISVAAALIALVLVGWLWITTRQVGDDPPTVPDQQQSRHRAADAGTTVPYVGLDPTYVLIGAPVVSGFAGEVPLREWLRHEHPTNDHVWRDVVAEFYGRAAADPEIAAYFDGVDLETLQRHFLATLLLVSGQGLTVGAVTQMRDRHSAVVDTDGHRITGPVYEKTVRVLLAVLQEHGVPPATLTQVFAVLAPLREAIVGGGRRHA